jgi:hypothetical protein
MLGKQNSNYSLQIRITDKILICLLCKFPQLGVTVCTKDWCGF